MRFLIPCLVFAFLSASCQKGGVPSPNTPSATALGSAQTSKDSQIAAYSEGTEVALKTLPDSPAKTAAFESNSVVRRLAGPATEKDRIEALKLVQLALVGKLDEAQKGFAKARSEADAHNLEIADLKKRIESERIAYDAKVQAEIEKAQKKWQMGIFFGGGALASVLGVMVLVLVANPVTAISYPFLGPKLGWACLGSGLVLISLGVAVNAVERLIDNHPWIFGLSLAVAVGLGLIAAAMSYANHHNHLNERTNR